jgi:hypothetical protein
VNGNLSHPKGNDIMRSLKAINTQIHSDWDAILEKASVPAAIRPELPLNCRLLGTGTKTEKGERERYLTAVVYMSPADELWGGTGTRSLCPFSTEGCRATCLGAFAGRMIMRPVKNSRAWKAALFVGNRALWTELAHAEVAQFERKAIRKGYRPAVRFDGSTDTGIGAEIAPHFPGVSFYDYTKVAHRALKHAIGNYAANYHVTFSFSGSNGGHCKEVLRHGGNVAAVFSTKEFPESFQGFSVYSADETDLRFTDKGRGAIGALAFKSATSKAKGREIAGDFIIDSAEGSAAFAAGIDPFAN